jgi:hypothetical protein
MIYGMLDALDELIDGSAIESELRNAAQLVTLD